jgi:hypothetical protein
MSSIGICKQFAKSELETVLKRVPSFSSGWFRPEGLRWRKSALPIEGAS